MLERAKDPEFWEEVRTEEKYRSVRETLMKLWETECSGEIAVPTYSEYQAFFRTGSHDPYWTPYRRRRMQTGIPALLALIYPGEERYLEKAVDAVWATLDEYAWTPPEHVCFFHGDPAEDIDLFAGETAAQIAEICGILGDRIPEDVRTRARKELTRRTLRGFENNTYEWETCGNNWMMVCLYAVTSVILFLCPERLEEFLPRMRRIVRGYFDAYKDDGVCIEGMVYWGYGISRLIMLSDLVEEATNGRVRLWEEAGDKWRNIIGWYSRMSLGHGSIVSFDDVNMEQYYVSYLAGYIRRRWPEHDITRGEAKPVVLCNCDPFCAYLREILWHEPPDPAPVPEHTEYFPDTGWLVKCGKRYGFAAKGGENTAPFQADLGAFLVARKGVQYLTDPGDGERTQEYFSRRYENFHVSSRGHCVPIVDGKYQRVGGGAVAPTEWKDGVFSTELAAAYDEPGLKTLLRRLTPLEDRVILEDAWEFETGGEKPVTERFVTELRPERTAEGYRIGESLLRAGAEAAAASAVTEEAPPSRGPYWCIDFTLPPEAKSFRAELLVPEN